MDRKTRTSTFIAQIKQEWSDYLFDFLTAHHDKLYYLDYRLLTINDNITMETIEKNLDKPWDFNRIYENKNARWSHIKKYIDNVKHSYLFGLYFQSTYHFKEDYEANPELREIQFMKTDSKYKHFTIDDILDAFYSGKTIPWHYVAQNANVYPHHIIDHNIIHLNNYAEYSPNMNIDVLREICKREPNINWHFITQNSSFTIEDIVSTADEFPWNYEAIPFNPNLRFEWILEHPELKCPRTGDVYDYDRIELNKFTAEREAFFEKRISEYLAAYRIQQWWLRIRYDPSFKVCREKVERDYEKMFD